MSLGETVRRLSIGAAKRVPLVARPSTAAAAQPGRGRPRGKRSLTRRFFALNRRWRRPCFGRGFIEIIAGTRRARILLDENKPVRRRERDSEFLESSFHTS